MCLKSTRITLACAICGTKVVRYPSRVCKSGRVFCQECRDQISEPAVSRFWKNVTKTDSCWVWTGSIRVRCGYGRIRSHGKAYATHRFSWELHFGPISGGLQVNHKCDNRLCVRPDHLYLGTQADNMRDKIVRGRDAKGERCKSSKLTEGDVIAIHALVRSGTMTRRAIAARFGVRPRTIWAIVSGRSWRHIPPQPNFSPEGVVKSFSSP